MSLPDGKSFTPTLFRCSLLAMLVPSELIATSSCGKISEAGTIVYRSLDVKFCVLSRKKFREDCNHNAVGHLEKDRRSVVDTLYFFFHHCSAIFVLFIFPESSSFTSTNTRLGFVYSP